MKPIRDVTDADLRALIDKDPEALRKFDQELRQATKLLEQYVLVGEEFGYPAMVILSALGEIFAQQVSRFTWPGTPEETEQHRATLLDNFAGIIRRRVAIKVEQLRVEELARAVREAESATKH